MYAIRSYYALMATLCPLCAASSPHNSCVITSYSIHYTKLYDPTDVFVIHILIANIGEQALRLGLRFRNSISLAIPQRVDGGSYLVGGFRANLRAVGAIHLIPVILRGVVSYNFV